MRFLLFLNFLFSVCFLSACMSRRSAEVIEALELAGRNRSELERVLDHYAACEADSLKLRAAELLIANMVRKSIRSFVRSIRCWIVKSVTLIRLWWD